MMQLVVLGSGTCVPSLRRNASGYLLISDNMQVLLDCGEGVMRQMLLARYSFQDIDAVFISHYHPDHVSGLLPMLHAMKNSPGNLRQKNLQVVGPPGLIKFFQNSIWSNLAKPETFQVLLTEIEHTFQFKSFHVLAGPTIHTKNSLAYRFENKGKILVYSGDSDYDDALINLADSADLFVVECSYPDSMKAVGHLVPRECGMIGEQAQVKKILLTHIYPFPFPDDILVRECREMYQGEVVLAEDLMEVVV